MPLYKLEEFDHNYRETFGGDDVKALELYTQGEVRIGSVADALVDENGRFRYLVIDISLDSATKKILLPIGLSRINYSAKRVYVDALSKQQIERLPEYREETIINDEYEEKVRNVYRPPTGNVTYDRHTYTYQQDPDLYNLSDQHHQTFRLYEERLIANKNRIKTGEVVVGKHVERDTARVSVPIQKEGVVIERVLPIAAGTVVDPNELKFHEGEVAHIEVYEERPDIHKEAFVREEIRIKKVVDHETFETEQVVRREELDIDTKGDLHVNQSGKTQNESR
ncbi:MAG: DUF2382 domain-containing protein [Gloeotrichia echinulata IR180]|jgi:uncharacterized protein (TIGR02271 family)|nr:DUF2382 domain-containing protein [Gloeotrichia echinulata DEX184]